jgi:flagellar capping protein FliD
MKGRTNTVDREQDKINKEMRDIERRIQDLSYEIKNESKLFNLNV